MGRQTGSLAWRQQRGELGVQAAYESHMFSPTPTQVEQKKMVIKYYCATNKYTHGDESIHDWMTGKGCSCRRSGMNSLSNQTCIHRSVSTLLQVSTSVRM